MNEETDLLMQVIGVLESMNVPYMIGGSVALSVWALPRATHDLDLVVDLPEDRITEFCAQFPSDRYFIDPETMNAAFQQRDQPGLGMYSFIDMDSGFKVDLFPLLPNDPAQQAALSRRVTVDIVEGQRAAVYAPDDLLVQKLRWYAASQSERQFRDCLNLVLTDLKRPMPLIAWDYIENWVAQLGPAVQQAWSAVKAAVNATNQAQSLPDSST
jgi:hypothetical protein